MFGSLQLGRVFGIPVRVHWLLIILLFVLAANSVSPLATLIQATILILVVGLHELGHCLMARHFGAHVLDITFWPLGGMARMSDLPENTRAEISIALAGPAVNFVLALAAFALLLPLSAAAGFELGPGLGPWVSGVTSSTPGSGALEPLSPWLSLALGATSAFLVINLMLGIFNLVPAFPMDGGRVLRAFLGRNRDWVTATEQAVRVSRWLAVAMVIAGFAWPRLILLPIIAIFVWVSGTRELWSVRLRHGRLPFGRGAPASEIFDQLFQQGPTNGRHDGTLTESFDEFEVQAAEPEPGTTHDTATQGAQRPAAWTFEAGPPSERLTDEKLAELERFRGRLPRSSG